MNALQLTFVYYPDPPESEPTLIAEVAMASVPRIGETVLIDPTEAEGKGQSIRVWEVVDVFYELPKSGAAAETTHVTVFIDPAATPEPEPAPITAPAAAAAAPLTPAQRKMQQRQQRQIQG